jgi:hypothetical protein
MFKRSFKEQQLFEMTYQEMRDLTINEIHTMVKRLRNRLPSKYKIIIDEIEPDMYEDLIAEIAYDGGIKGRKITDLKIPMRILDRYDEYYN